MIYIDIVVALHVTLVHNTYINQVELKKMTNLIENLISKASKNGVDVKLDGNLTLKYKKTKFKTWSGKFTYETRKDLLVSLLFLAKKGYPSP